MFYTKEKVKTTVRLMKFDLERLRASGDKGSPMTVESLFSPPMISGYIYRRSAKYTVLSPQQAKICWMKNLKNSVGPAMLQ